MTRNFVSNSEDSIRMFKSSFLESLSKVHFSVPLIIYIPVITFLSVRSIQMGLPLYSFLGYFVLGIFIWTLTEYVLHKYVFHYLPSSKWGLRLHFIFHGVHHDYPRDRMRLVMPPSASILIASAFYFFFSLFFSAMDLKAFFAGFLLGYLFYDMGHYAIHHLNWKNPWFVKIKQHHMLHHYHDPTKGFGVSSPLWDRILNSDFPNELRIPSGDAH